MNRREWLLATGAMLAAAKAAAAPKGSEPHVHDSPNAGLVDAAADCEKKAQACLTHCLGMLSTGDTSMAACAATVRDTIASVQALGSLAAANSKHLKSMARTCSEICRDCEAECRKHQDKMQVCRECADACAAMIKEAAKVA
jgi:Cys-rich four helix bundle protein (predicted Tat secretion target)